jgi:hypothetical protein
MLWQKSTHSCRWYDTYLHMRLYCEAKLLEPFSELLCFARDVAVSPTPPRARPAIRCNNVSALKYTKCRQFVFF